MVEAYNAAATRLGFSTSQMRAVEGDLLGPCPPSGPEFSNFDIVTCGMAYHHLSSPAQCTKVLAERLVPGGILLISDFVKQDADDMPEAVKQHVGHAINGFGFEEWEIRKLFEDAGLVDVDISVLEENAVMVLKGNEVERTVFFAKGRKPNV